MPLAPQASPSNPWPNTSKLARTTHLEAESTETHQPRVVKKFGSSSQVLRSCFPNLSSPLGRRWSRTQDLLVYATIKTKPNETSPDQACGGKKERGKTQRECETCSFCFRAACAGQRKNELASPMILFSTPPRLFDGEAQLERGTRPYHWSKMQDGELAVAATPFSKTPCRRPASIRLNMAWYSTVAVRGAAGPGSTEPPEPVARARLPTQTCQKQGTDMHVGYRSRHCVGGAVVEPSPTPQRTQSHARLSCLSFF